MNPHPHDSEEAEGWEASFDKGFWPHPDATDYVDALATDVKDFIKQTRAEAEIAGEAKGRLMGFEVGVKTGLEEARRVVEEFKLPKPRGEQKIWNDEMQEIQDAITNRIEEN